MCAMGDTEHANASEGDVPNVHHASNNAQHASNVRNADINVTLPDGRVMIFNTLLTFCVSAISNATRMNVVQLIAMSFGEDEVAKAKVRMARLFTNLVKIHHIDQKSMPMLKISMMV